MIDSDAVVHEVQVELAPDEVCEVFCDPARLVRWLGLSASLDPVAGGAFRFEVQPGQFCEGEYVEIRRPAFVSFTVEWSPAGDGTRVRLTHSRLPGDLRAIHDEGWTTFLERLVATAVGHEPTEYPPTGTPP